jgi:hypothetical protein
MSRIAMVMEQDGFQEWPVVLPEDELTVMGRTIRATMDLSRVAAEAGDRLGSYLSGLEALMARSPFHWHCRYKVEGVSPPRLAGNLGRILWQRVDFTGTDFTGAVLEGSIALLDCKVASDLPAMSIEPGELLVYPLPRAERELRLTDIREILVLRWGLARRGGHLAEALLWLQPRHSTRPLLEKILARPERRLGTIGRSDLLQ